jgi:hypothetical protein
MSGSKQDALKSPLGFVKLIWMKLGLPLYTCGVNVSAL